MIAQRLNFRRSRQALTISEMVIAMAITSVALVSIAQLMSLATRQYRMIDGRRLASQEAANVMEHLMLRTWDEIASKDQVKVELSEAFLQRMPDALIQAKIETDADDEDARRITVQINLANRGPKKGVPLQLVAWRYRHEEQAP